MFIFHTLFLGTLVAVGALIAGPKLAMLFDASLPVIHLGIFRYVGAVGGTIALLFALYSAVFLIMGRSCAAPDAAGGSFSVLGPYRIMRNPFMLAIVVALWCEALYFEKLALIFFAFLFTWLAHAWVVFYEEPALRRAFGKTYLDYHKSVPRWLPRLKSK